MDDLINRLSEIRSKYNCFDENEEPYYRALSEAIKILYLRTDGDTISRQAAIDAICDNCDTVEASCPHYPCSRYVAVEKLPSALQWIPCDIMYPEMDERVLVFTVGHEYHVWDCMSNRSDNYFWEDEDGLYHDKYEVDLWMPLPDPYKEDDE